MKFLRKFNESVESFRDIDYKLNIINNRRKKRSNRFLYTKEQMINDIKEVIQTIGGKITWKNPEVIWTMDEFIDSNGNSIKWEDMSLNMLESFIPIMNSIFIYGYGSNQTI